MSGTGSNRTPILDHVPRVNEPWKEFLVFDELEEEEIKKFERLRGRKTLTDRGITAMKLNPIFYVGFGGACYAIVAGLNSLISGHEYNSLKYLEMRIYCQMTAIGSIFLCTGWYYYKYKRDLIEGQPYGPYKSGYGMTHLDQLYRFNRPSDDDGFYMSTKGPKIIRDRMAEEYDNIGGVQ